MRFHEPENFFSPPNKNPYIINGREYVDGLGTIRTVEEYGYSYSPYYLAKAKDFNDLKLKAEWYYSDRMQSWDVEKYRAAMDAATLGKGYRSNFFEKWGTESHSKFVKTYFGETYIWVATANGRNFATGYDYYIFMVVNEAKNEQASTS